MDRPYLDFFIEMIPELPGCPEPYIEQALKQTSIDFCRRSKALRADMDLITLEEGVQRYDLDAPQGYEVEDIVRCTFVPDGMPLTPMSISDADASLPGWEQRTGTRPDHYVLFSEEKQIRFIPDPNQTISGAIAMRAAFRPNQDSTGLDEVFFEEWMQDIAFGAKARLMMQPKKPWTDQQTATLYEQKFQSAIKRARRRAERDNTRAPRLARAVPFGGYIGQYDRLGGYFRV